MSYIKQHQASQTRYQIDKYLIEAGYNPAEIELVWQTINQKGYNSDKDKSKRNLTPYLMEAKNPQLWIILVIGIAVLAVLGAGAGLFGPVISIGGSPRL